MAQSETPVAKPTAWATAAGEGRVDIAALAAWARTGKGEARAYAPDDAAPSLKAPPKTPSDVEMIALLQKSAASSPRSLAIQTAQELVPLKESARLEGAQLPALTARIPNERIEPERAGNPMPSSAAPAVSAPYATPAHQAAPATAPNPPGGDGEASWAVTTFRFQRGADNLTEKASAALAQALKPLLNEVGTTVELAAGISAGASLDDLLIANRRLTALAKSIPSQIEITRRFDPQVPLDAIEIRFHPGRV